MDYEKKYIDAEKLLKAIEEKGLDCSFALKMERLDPLALIDELQQEQPEVDLDEAAEKYANRGISSNADPYEETIAYRADKDAFKAGAEWQKEQMMKEAVEGEVQYFGETQGVPRTIKIPRMQEWLKPFKDGDKVRIIIVEEDER